MGPIKQSSVVFMRNHQIWSKSHPTPLKAHIECFVGKYIHPQVWLRNFCSKHPMAMIRRAFDSSNVIDYFTHHKHT